MTISFLKTAKLTFSYKTSSEAKWDYLKVYRITEAAGKETETLLNEADKEAFSGEMSDYASYSVEVQAGERSGSALRRISAAMGRATVSG